MHIHTFVGDSVDEISLIADEVAPIYRVECRAERDDTQVGARVHVC